MEDGFAEKAVLFGYGLLASVWIVLVAALVFEVLL